MGIVRLAHRASQDRQSRGGTPRLILLCPWSRYFRLGNLPDARQSLSLDDITHLWHLQQKTIFRYKQDLALRILSRDSLMVATGLECLKIAYLPINLGRIYSPQKTQTLTKTILTLFLTLLTRCRAVQKTMFPSWAPTVALTNSPTGTVQKNKAWLHQRKRKTKE